MIAQAERWRRWQLALGVDDEQNALSESDRRLNAALASLYDTGHEKRKGGLGASAPQNGLATFASSFRLPSYKSSRKMPSSGST